MTLGQWDTCSFLFQLWVILSILSVPFNLFCFRPFPPWFLFWSLQNRNSTILDNHKWHKVKTKLQTQNDGLMTMGVFWRAWLASITGSRRCKTYKCNHGVWKWQKGSFRPLENKNTHSIVLVSIGIALILLCFWIYCFSGLWIQNIRTECPMSRWTPAAQGAPCNTDWEECPCLPPPSCIASQALSQQEETNKNIPHVPGRHPVDLCPGK